MNNNHKAFSLAGLVVALGVVFGDIGTSPLYTVRATLHLAGGVVTHDIVFGIISLIFWTLTLQTTIKYVMITLRADNKGEGGIFSLYTLVKEKKRWLVVIAIIGGAMLLADGIITPAITVTSAIQGLKLLSPGLTQNTVILIVGIILTLLFFIQRFGTSLVGKLFGPLMILWFLFIGSIGVYNIIGNPEILLALNPYYGVLLLFTNPVGILLLGGIFLCTTGAEALYSDLGHCGQRNIKISWIFVKIALVANYAGQGAYLLNMENQVSHHVDPFFDIIPGPLLGFGVVIATIAAIIASQALISGSFTLVSEAIKLNLFPKLQISYPTDIKGQSYIPKMSTFLWVGAMTVVWYFRRAESMEAAYGLAITITMLMTTILLLFYLKDLVAKPLAYLLFSTYALIEGIFLVANLQKFFHGGYITLGIAMTIMLLMYVWRQGHEIKLKNFATVAISDFTDQLESLTVDEGYPLYASNLVYLSDTEDIDLVERKVMYSILNLTPKRATHYWFVHLTVTDEPYTQDYEVNRISAHSTKVVFKLGFRVNQRLMTNYLKHVIANLIRSGEIPEQPRHYSITKHKPVVGHIRLSDLKFIILKEYLSNYHELNFMDTWIVKMKFFIKKFSVSPENWFGLENSSFAVENAPMIIGAGKQVQLHRVDVE